MLILFGRKIQVIKVIKLISNASTQHNLPNLVPGFGSKGRTSLGSIGDIKVVYYLSNKIVNNRHFSNREVSDELSIFK
jgi:hypothetical protein